MFQMRRKRRLNEGAGLLAGNIFAPQGEAAVHGEIDRISQALTQRVKELAERYGTPMPELIDQVTKLEQKVNRHLDRMGFAWK